MKKTLILGTGVVATAARACVGAGAAAADGDLVGQTFSKAKATLAQQGMGATVGSIVGDREDRDDCVVTSASKASFLDSSGNSTGNNMVLNLNCYATHGSAGGPGFSAGSPEGRASLEAEEAAKQKAAQEQSALDELEAADASQAGE